MKVLCNEISGSSDRTSCQIPDKLGPNSAAKQSLPHQRQLHLNKSMRMARPEGGKWVILLLMLYSQKPNVEYLWRSVKGERRVMQKPWWWRGSWAQTLDLGITQPAGPYHQHSKNQRKNTKNTWKITEKHRKHREITENTGKINQIFLITQPAAGPTSQTQVLVFLNPLYLSFHSFDNKILSGPVRGRWSQQTCTEGWFE